MLHPRLQGDILLYSRVLYVRRIKQQQPDHVLDYESMYFTRTRFKIYVLLLETMYAYGDIHCVFLAPGDISTTYGHLLPA